MLRYHLLATNYSFSVMGRRVLGTAPSHNNTNIINFYGKTIPATKRQASTPNGASAHGSEQQHPHRPRRTTAVYADESSVRDLALLLLKNPRTDEVGGAFKPPTPDSLLQPNIFNNLKKNTSNPSFSSAAAPRSDNLDFDAIIAAGDHHPSAEYLQTLGRRVLGLLLRTPLVMAEEGKEAEKEEGTKVSTRQGEDRRNSMMRSVLLTHVHPAVAQIPNYFVRQQQKAANRNDLQPEESGNFPSFYSFDRHVSSVLGYKGISSLLEAPGSGEKKGQPQLKTRAPQQPLFLLSVGFVYASDGLGSAVKFVAHCVERCVQLEQLTDGNK